MTGPKVPKRGEAVNEVRKTALSPGQRRTQPLPAARPVALIAAAARAGHCAMISARWEYFARNRIESLTKRRFFNVYQKLLRTL
jgi:hypothetical protein